MRIAGLRPADLDPAQAELYDLISGGPRAAGRQHFPLTADDGSLRGPFNAMLLSPTIGRAQQSIGAALRYESRLSARGREIAILLVAARWESRFERESHEAVARSLGFDDADLAALASSDISRLMGDESILGVTVCALLDGDLDDEEWARATAVFGDAGVYELSTFVGYYAMLALQLRVFRV